MRGGYYVTVLDDKKRPAFIAGPFDTYEQANEIGPKAKQLVEDKYDMKLIDNPEWGIGYFTFHATVYGLFNAELWLPVK